MGDYLRDDSKNLIRESSIREISDKFKPIEPKKNKWAKLQNPDTIVRSFEFSSIKQKMYFLEDVMQLEDELQHYSYMYIDNNVITITLQTKLIEKVTEIDVEMAAEIDKIYDDCKS